MAEIAAGPLEFPPDDELPAWGNYRDVPICEFVKLSRQRQRRDLWRAKNDPSFPFYYDDDAADHAVWYISELRHVEGEWAGRPFELSDWQEWDIVRPLFGWKHKETKRRRFRTFYVEVPRKNGKSTLISSIALYTFQGDNEPGAQVYCAATKEKQARIVWDVAKKMLMAADELNAHAYFTKRNIADLHLGSKFEPLGRDSRTEDGLNVHAGFIDEYHAHKTREIFDILKTAQGARRNPMIGIITTAGLSSAGPCKRESDTAKNMLRGVVPMLENYLAYICTVDDENKLDDPIEWQKANPNFGISIYEESFKSDFDDAKLRPEEWPSFICKRLNIWANKHSRWLSSRDWDACGGEVWPAELAAARTPCFGGLDLSSNQDLTAFVLAFDCGRKVKLLPFFFCPEDTILERERVDGVPYDAWRRMGLILPTPGNAIDHNFVKQKILELAATFNIQEIAFDPYNASQLMGELRDEGLVMVQVRQGWSMNEPSKALQARVLRHEIEHGGHEVLRWNACNCVIKTDPLGNIRPDKEKSLEKIDGLVASIMALGRLILHQESGAQIMSL